MLELVIGNRNYSSWSLRAWLFLKESGIPFIERRLSMFTESWHASVRDLSPAGRVPVLLDGPLRVWDSLAIIEHLLENHSPRVGWPEDPASRAEARSVTAELHSGFIALRGELPQNLRVQRRLPRFSDACASQVERIHEIVRAAHERSGGQSAWLYGDFTIADIFFAPVVLRFRTYGLPLPDSTERFLEAVERLESVREWCQLAHQESERIAFIDDLVPADESPLTLG